MTQEEFIRKLPLLDDKVTYIKENGKLIIRGDEAVSFIGFTSLCDNLVFEVDQDIHLRDVLELPNDIIFSNVGGVYLGDQTKIPCGATFNMRDDISSVKLNRVSIGKYSQYDPISGEISPDNKLTNKRLLKIMCKQLGGPL
jgi:hypothetical protein